MGFASSWWRARWRVACGTRRSALIRANVLKGLEFLGGDSKWIRDPVTRNGGARGRHE